MPSCVIGLIYELNHRPGSNLIVGCCDIGGVPVPPCPSCVTRIRCISINRFNYIISSVKSFIPYKLDLNGTVVETFNCEHCNILLLVRSECNLQDYIVNISIRDIRDHYIIDVSVIIKVEVVYP